MASLSNKKVCSCCKIEKSKDLFYSNKARSNGVYSRCIDCEKKYIKTFNSIDIPIEQELLNYEYFKDIIIDGVEYPYSISNCGRVYIKSQKKIARPSLDQRGYPQIVLTSNGKRLSRRIHRIVALMFIDNPENKREVNHKDCNKLNNHVSNLEWVTSKDNSKHAIENKLR